MSAGFLAVVSSVGIPIFTRTFGQVEAPSLSTLGVLVATALSASELQLNILHYSITWSGQDDETMIISTRCYHDAVILLLGSVGDTSSVRHIHTCVLDVVASYMVMMLGVPELKILSSSPSRNKSAWRAMFTVIDTVLACIHSGTAALELVYHSPRHTALEARSDEILTSCFCSFASQYVVLIRCMTPDISSAYHASQYMARKELGHNESLLCVMMSRSCTDGVTYDIPVYLAVTSRELLIVSDADGINISKFLSAVCACASSSVQDIPEGIAPISDELQRCCGASADIVIPVNVAHSIVAEVNDDFNAVFDSYLASDHITSVTQYQDPSSLRRDQSHDQSRATHYSTPTGTVTVSSTSIVTDNLALHVCTTPDGQHTVIMGCDPHTAASTVLALAGDMFHVYY